jgi:hypothetical protein
VVNCESCREDLKKGLFHGNRDWKSCPRCSTDNGRQHVYYPYPDDFGTTDKRKSGPNPDGPQSYCLACRDRGQMSSRRLLCSTVQNALAGRGRR